MVWGIAGRFRGEGKDIHLSACRAGNTLERLA